MKRMTVASFVLFCILGIAHNSKGDTGTSPPQGREPQASLEETGSQRTRQAEEVAPAACKSEEAPSNEAISPGVAEKAVGSGEAEPSRGEVINEGESRNEKKEPVMVPKQEWSSSAESEQKKQQEQKQAGPEDSERGPMER